MENMEGFEGMKASLHQRHRRQGIFVVRPRHGELRRWIPPRRDSSRRVNCYIPPLNLRPSDPVNIGGAKGWAAVGISSLPEPSPLSANILL